MRRHRSRIGICVGMAGVLTIGCGGQASPAGPAPVPNAATTAFTGGSTAAQSAAQPPEAGRPTPADLMSRGWTCFIPPPAPNRTVCSHPGQGLPTVATPPPADRPATFTFWIYESGSFAGTELLIRTDLYKGQVCESTGQPYVFVPFIGYYECVHTPGR